MPYTVVDGRPKRKPGAYGTTRVISDQGAPAIDFNVGVMLGKADEGCSFNWNTDQKRSGEENYPVFYLCEDSGKAKANFGQYSELDVAMEWAKKHSMPEAYCIPMNELTRATILLKKAAATHITLYTKKGGYPQNFHKVTVIANGANRKIRVTPYLYYIKLAADVASTARRLYAVSGGDKLKAGMTITLTDADTISPFSETVTIKNVYQKKVELSETVDGGLTGSILKVGQLVWIIDLTIGTTNVYEEAKFASLVEWSNTYQETAEYDTSAELVADINLYSDYLYAELTLATDVPDAFSAAMIKDIASTTTATTGALTGTSRWDTFITAAPALFTSFKADTRKRPRIFWCGTGDHDALVKMRDFAITRRTEREPIAVIGGIEWGCVLTGADKDYRPDIAASNLNLQDFQLAGQGWDKIAAYLSQAAAIFGIRVGNWITHNMTNDIVYCSELEKEFTDAEIETLLLFGVTITQLTQDGPRIVQSLNTLQMNDKNWNVNEKTTCLPMQRDCADYNQELFINGLNREQVGADEITADGVRAYAAKTIDDILTVYRTAITCRLTAVVKNATNNGWKIRRTEQLPSQDDYFEVEQNILA